jgi:hypothetical protein
LVAATLASTSSASAGAINFQDFCIGGEFLHSHLERVDWGAANTAEAVRIFQTMSHLLVSNKVSVTKCMCWAHWKKLKMFKFSFQPHLLEFRLGFATQTLLAKSTSGLAHLHHRTVL